MIDIIGTSLNQWDTGRSVKISAVDADRVHFANKGDSRAVIMEAVNGEATIPNYLLQTGKQLCVYAVKNGVTVESRVFFVQNRERPENYVYDEDQRNYIYELISKAEAAIEGAHSAYEDAHLAVEAANTAVVNANIAIENTNKAADDAKTAATNANVAATQAAKTANDAATEAAQTANEAAAKAVQTANDAAAKASHTAKSLMVIGGAEGVRIHLDDAAEQYLVGLRAFGKTAQEGTPTPTAPVELNSSVDGTSMSINVSGKNLFTGWIVGGITTSSGEDSDNETMRRTDYLPLYSAGQSISVSGIPSTLYNRFAFYDADKKYIERSSAGSSAQRFVNAPVNAKYFRFTIYESSSATGLISEADAMASKTMIEAGTDYTAYERGKTVQTATISVPTGLRGIPVTSGGNYTDANGQQWICDEIDFHRGVYIQRTGVIALDGSSDETWIYFTSIGNQFHTPVANCYHSNSVSSVHSTHFAPGIIGDRANTFEICYSYSEGVAFNTHLAVSKEEWRAWLAANPITALYRLAVPVETPIAAEDLAAFNSLHTHRQETIISNDGFAYMELEYVMDAKKYIDSMISSTILQATVE